MSELDFKKLYRYLYHFKELPQQEREQLITFFRPFATEGYHFRQLLHHAKAVGVVEALFPFYIYSDIFHYAGAQYFLSKCEHAQPLGNSKWLAKIYKQLFYMFMLTTHYSKEAEKKCARAVYHLMMLLGPPHGDATIILDRFQTLCKANQINFNALNTFFDFEDHECQFLKMDGEEIAAWQKLVTTTNSPLTILLFQCRDLLKRYHIEIPTDMVSCQWAIDCVAKQIDNLQDVTDLLETLSLRFIDAFKTNPLYPASLRELVARIVQGITEESLDSTKDENFLDNLSAIIRQLEKLDSFNDPQGKCELQRIFIKRLQGQSLEMFIPEEIQGLNLLFPLLKEVHIENIDELLQLAPLKAEIKAIRTHHQLEKFFLHLPNAYDKSQFIMRYLAPGQVNLLEVREESGFHILRFLRLSEKDRLAYFLQKMDPHVLDEVKIDMTTLKFFLREFRQGDQVKVVQEIFDKYPALAAQIRELDWTFENRRFMLNKTCRKLLSSCLSTPTELSALAVLRNIKKILYQNAGAWDVTSIANPLSEARISCHKTVLVPANICNQVAILLDVHQQRLSPIEGLRQIKEEGQKELARYAGRWGMFYKNGTTKAYLDKFKTDEVFSMSFGNT